MSRLALLQRLQTNLRARTWGGTGDTVFADASVRITAAPTEQALGKLRDPIALIRPLDASADPEHGEEPDLFRQRVEIVLIARVSGDEVGENVMVGANRTGGSSASEGRGLLEIEGEMWAAVELLQKEDSVTILNRTEGAAQATFDEDTGYIAWATYTFDAWETRA